MPHIPLYDGKKIACPINHPRTYAINVPLVTGRFHHVLIREVYCKFMHRLGLVFMVSRMRIYMFLELIYTLHPTCIVIMGDGSIGIPGDVESVDDTNDIGFRNRM